MARPRRQLRGHPSGGWRGNFIFLRHLRRPAVAFFLTLAALTLIATPLLNAIRLPASFSVTATTEVLDMVTAKAGTTRWYIRDAIATVGFGDPLSGNSAASIADLLARTEPRSVPFSGFLDIGPCMRVQMTRYGNRPIRVVVETDDNPGNHSQECSNARRDSSKQESDDNGSSFNIRLENKLNTTVPTPQWPTSVSLEVNVQDYPFSGGFRGNGVIGMETYNTNAAQAPPMLRDGRITALGKALVTNDRFQMMERALELGDQVRIIDQDGRDASAACVFSATAAQDTSGFDVSCRVKESAIQISRLGADPFEMLPTLWAYLKGDPIFQTLLALIGSVLLVLFEYILDRVPVRQAPEP